MEEMNTTTQTTPTGSDGMNTNYQNQSGQTVIIKEVAKKSNGIGTTGFIIALIGLFLCWVPYLNFILWLLGLIFSFIGVFKKPKGLSIAGLSISLIVITLIVIFIGALFSATSQAPSHW
jgi:hypothetical protein